MTLKWGILGCGDVAEYKGGPPLYSVEGSERLSRDPELVRRANTLLHH